MGSKLMLTRLRELRKPDEPVIVTGDFNCPPGSAAYRAFLQDGFVDTFFACNEPADASTCHAFGGLWHRLHHGAGPMRIDMILLNDPVGQIKVELHRIVHDGGEGTGIYPSDHYPVFTDLSLTRREASGYPDRLEAEAAQS
jgi:endonuclease/exonuclease/phosphatase family metal-dependent hydrolase